MSNRNDNKTVLFTDPMTDDEYDDMIEDMANDPTINRAFDAVIDLLDGHLTGLDRVQRLFLSTHLATTITAHALANHLRDNQHLLNQAVEALAEDTADKTEHLFQVINKGEL